MPFSIASLIGHNQKRLIGVILSALILIMVYFWVDILLNSSSINYTTIWTWLVCVGVLFTADLLSAPTGNKQWAGFLYFSISVAWLTLGVAPALTALFISVGLTAFLRWRHIGLPLWDHNLPYISFNASCVRIAVIGSGMLIMAGVFALLDGELPFSPEQDLLITVVAMLCGFVVLQFVGWLISDPLEESEFGMFLFHRAYLSRQLFILSLAIPFVIVRIDSGMLIFTILMILIALQPIRTFQIRYTQQILHQRVQELSLLSDVGHSISTEVTLDAVLRNICRQVSDLVQVSLFYIGLYDNQRNLMEFPLVMRDGKREYWDKHPLESETFTDMMEMHSVLKVRRGNNSGMDELFISLPDDVEHRVYLGLPLIVGSKLIGIMVLIGNEAVLNPSNVQISTMKTLANQAALAIRNTILYERSTQLAQNLNYINRSVQDVMFNLDDNSALQMACETALKITGANKVAIFLLDIRDDDVPIARLVRSIGLIEAHEALYANPVYCPTIFHSDAHVIPDVDRLSDRDVLVDLAEAGHFRSMVEVPLKQVNSVIGVLTIFHDEAHYYHMIELELLEILAYQITAALDNAQLLNALEEYASEQAQLVQLSRISTSSLNIKLVITNVCDMLQQIMDVNYVSVGLLVDDKSSLQIYNSEGVSKTALAMTDVQELYNLINTKPLTPRIFHKDQHPKTFDEFLLITSDPTLAMLAVNPLGISDDLLGFIFLGDRVDYSFTDGEWRRIEMAVNQIATQLHNIQEHARTQIALEKRLQELAIIEDIAHQISSAHNPDEIIRNVMKAALLSTRADIASFTLFTDDNVFRVLAIEYVNGEVRHFETVLQGVHGVIARVLHTKETLIITDNEAESDYVGLTMMRRYRSSLIMPLQDENNVIVGVLSLESTQLGYFDTEHLKFTKNLVRHASISIQNARLLTERQNQIETLTRLRELSLQFAKDNTQDAVVTAILRTAIELLQGQSAALFLNRDESSMNLPMLGCLRRVGEIYLPDRLPIPQSLINEVVDSGEIYVVEDVTLSKHFKGYHALDAVDYKGLMLAPLKRGNAVSEVLCVALSMLRAYRKADENTLALLAIQAEGYLQNAILYERVRTDSSRMRAILDSTRDGIILLDTDGRLIDANISAEDLLGVDLENKIGLSFPQILTAHLEEIVLVDKESATYESLADLARVLRIEPQRITSHSLEIPKSGKIRYIEEVGSPVYNQDAQIMGRLLTLRDVTEERLLIAYRDEISSMVVHDLRGPLGAIISSLELSKEIVIPLKNETLDEIVKVSLDSARQLLDLVDSLLDIAKLETRRMILNRVPTSVRDLAEKASRTLSTIAQDSDIEIVFDFPDNLPEVFVDADKIRRVIINLLDNAMRFSPAGKPIIIAAEQISNKRVKVMVADSGKGIPPEESEKVFEKFRQIKDNKPARGRKGTGLGLTFCKLTIEEHGETIWIDQNGPLPGACFTFTLPVVVADARSMTTSSIADVHTSSGVDVTLN